MTQKCFLIQIAGVMNDKWETLREGETNRFSLRAQDILTSFEMQDRHYLELHIPL